ncbi:MAG: Gfo/Idh/MocA family oxidoreductase [Williamsia sp.]|nr:Gfo/Idh/MocA family oxidoreductase [Williamsia sp.]
MNKTVRWGILGPGKIAHKFASALNHTPGAELVAVASRDAERAQHFANQFKARRAYSDYRQLAEDGEVDIVYVATPHAFHCEHTLLCLEHHKAVLCEKPLALNNEQVSRMINTARKQACFLMEGMWSRCLPFTRKIEALLDEIGPVQFVRADFGFRAPADPASRLFDPALGGGSLLDVGIYPIALATLFLGEPAGIYATGRLAATGADEYCNIQLRYPGGQSASLLSSIGMQTGLTAEIVGTKGRVEVPAPWYKTERFTRYLGFNEGQQEFHFPHDHNGYEYEIREAMRCLQEGLTESPLLPHSFSMQLSRIMDEVRRQCGVVYEAD